MVEHLDLFVLYQLIENPVPLSSLIGGTGL